MKKLPISVYMISGAEAHRIERSLKSVIGWASEIIVVLNEEVADGTEEIAKAHGAQVFREKWKGFIAQKNSALSKTSASWVFGLDCDEVVSPELQGELDALFATEPACAGYAMPRCSFYLERWIRHGDWYPDRCLRLWRRGRGTWAGTDPHATPKVEGAVSNLRGELLHFTSETLNHQVSKTVQYADDFVRHCRETGRRVTMFDLVFRPLWRFIRGYVFRGGFLDGWQGYSIACFTCFYTFLRYAKAREAQLHRQHGR